MTMGQQMARRFVAILGTVMAECGGKRLPLAGATVCIAGDGGVPMGATVSTGPDGRFAFRRLPEGKYTVGTRMPGTRYAAVSSTVVAKDAGRLAVEIVLSATTLTGNVLADAKPARWAEIRLMGSDERTVSRADGSFRLAAVEAGTRRMLVSVPGYPPQIAEVNIAAGTTEEITVTVGRGVGPPAGGGQFASGNTTDLTAACVVSHQGERAR